MTQPSAPPPSRTPSHLLPFVFGGVVLFLANLGVGGYRALQSDTSTDTAERAGEIFGVFLAMILAVGLVYGVTRFLKKPPRFGIVSFFTLGVLFLGQAGLMLSQFVANITITPADRAGLVITTDSIRHPTLGFSAPNPQGAYAASPALQHRLDSAFAGQAKIAAWALNSASRGNLIIEAARFSGMDETQFRAYVRGFRRRFIASADTVLADSVQWTTRGGVYDLAVHVRTIFVESRCLTHPGNSLVVCLQVTSKDSTGLGAIPAGLSLKESP